MSTVGNITEEAIKKYIQEQKEESKKRDEKIASFRGMIAAVLVIPTF